MFNIFQKQNSDVNKENAELKEENIKLSRHLKDLRKDSEIKDMHFLRAVKNRLLLQVVNQSGLVNYTNIKSGQPIAVTWGVFPGQEIVQVPTVDPQE